MLRFVISLGAVVTLAAPAAAVNLVIDYTYDTQGFFGAGNPDGAAAGAQARARIEAAADYLSGILDDSFSSIQTPAPYSSSAFNGVATWEWTASFKHPGTGSDLERNNPTIAADEYLIYAGGRSLGELGVGGPGGWGWRTGGNGGGFTPAEIDAINTITAAFGPTVERRAEPDGEFGRWGGVVAFDNDGSTNWHYGSGGPGGNESDFFSVALHELGHAVGFSASDEFSVLRSGTSFTGAASRAANGGTNPSLHFDDHWAENTQSTVFGGTTTQEAAMDPNVTVGTRKLWTTLDAAALTDIGWEVVTPVLDLPGDYNADGLVNAADYTTWRDNLGTPNATGTYSEWSTNYGASSTPTSTSTSIPEPSGLAFIVSTLVASTSARRRRMS